MINNESIKRIIAFIHVCILGISIFLQTVNFENTGLHSFVSIFFIMQLLISIELIVYVISNFISRVLFELIFISFTIVLSCLGKISPWYISVIACILNSIYMMWIIGCVRNYDTAIKQINETQQKINEGKLSYNNYSNGLEEFNSANNLGFFSRVRKKREPNWQKYNIKYNMEDIFGFGSALLGIDSSEYNRKSDKLNKCNTNLSGKNNAIESDRTLRHEKNALEKYMERKQLLLNQEDLQMKQNINKLNSIHKNNLKVAKKILRKKITK